MSPSVNSASQQWTRRIRYSDEHIRVSDVERNAVAERLSAHYADGRLDQAEFDERISRTMSAKTRGDLAGLFDDLPDPEPAGASGAGGPGGPAIPYRPRRRGGLIRPLLLAVLVIVFTSVVWHTVTSFYIPWFPIAVILAVAFFATRASRRR
jgi:uncharacterized protein DUF1707